MFYQFHNLHIQGIWILVELSDHKIKLNLPGVLIAQHLQIHSFFERLILYHFSAFSNKDSRLKLSACSEYQ